jgi:hypothetical protein
MSTLQIINLKHEDSSTNNIVLASDGSVTLPNDTVDIATLSATGTASSSTYLRGDNTWTAPDSGQIVYQGTAETATGASVVVADNIPAAAKKITLMLSAVTTNGSNDIMVQLGHSSGYYTSGYNSCGGYIVGSSANETGATDCFLIQSGDSAAVMNVVMEIYKVNSSDTSGEWVAGFNGADRNVYLRIGGGGLTGVTHDITHLKVLLNGSDNFDGGKFNLTWEL